MDPSPLSAWAESGAMWLTGRSDGAPLPAPGRPATHVDEQLLGLALHASRWGETVTPLPDNRILSERAAIAGLRRQGPLSCGGAFRTLPTRNGRIGLSLARPSDLELIPALTEGSPGAPWEAVAAWAREVDTSEADQRISLLDLPGGAVPEPGSTVSTRPAVATRRGGLRHPTTNRPLIIDFTSMWAGPLCAHLLGLAGADIVKIESTGRPDGARRGPAEFFDLLHAGHRSLGVEPGRPEHRAALQDLISRADLVLESSRPEALARWGLDAEAVVDSGTSWLSITARGRDSRRVGFGDDIAAGAGLYVEDRGEALPCGDALGDPITGAVAAHAAARALGDGRAHLIDISMHDVCAEAASGPHTPCDITLDADGNRWWVESDSGRVEVIRPRVRRTTGSAAPLGTHNHGVLL